MKKIPKEIQDIYREILDGSTTRHLGKDEKSPMRTFMRSCQKVLGVGVLLSSIMASQTGFAQDMKNIQNIKKDVAESLVEKLNAKFFPQNGITVILEIDNDAHEGKTFTFGAGKKHMTVCTSSSLDGHQEFLGANDGAISWTDNPDKAKTAFMMNLATDIFSCVNETQAGKSGPQKVTKYDAQSAIDQQLLGGAIMVDNVQHDTKALSLLQDEYRLYDAADLPSKNMVTAIEAIKGNGILSTSSFQEVSQMAAKTAVAAQGFQYLHGNMWKTIDDKIISTDKSSHDFGWKTVSAMYGDMGSEYVRTFAIPQDCQEEGEEPAHLRP